MTTPNSALRLRVLLVDASLPVRQRLRSLIEESVPVEFVGEAGTTATALKLFDAGEPDAVVLDLGLADGDGANVLSEMKQRRPGCAVIMLSSVAIPEVRDLCRNLGADHFFDKALEFECVPEVLRAMRCEGSPTKGGGSGS